MLRKILDHIEGQGLVEYGLILVLVAIVVIAALMMVGPAVGNIFSTIVKELAKETSSHQPPPECYGSLLLPIMIGTTGLGLGISYLLPNKPARGLEQ